MWVRDGRRIVHAGNGRLFVTDTASGVSHEILDVPGETLLSPRLAAGDSRLFFLRQVTEGDIWTMRFASERR